MMWTDDSNQSTSWNTGTSEIPINIPVVFNQKGILFNQKGIHFNDAIDDINYIWNKETTSQSGWNSEDEVSSSWEMPGTIQTGWQEN